MADQLIVGGFTNVFFPVLPEEDINGNGVYIQVQEYDSTTASIQEQYQLSQWQVMVRGDKLQGYKSAYDTMDDIRQYLINLPARFTINSCEYSNPEIISGPTYLKDDNDRDIAVLNLQTYYNPLQV